MPPHYHHYTSFGEQQKQPQQQQHHHNEPPPVYFVAIDTRGLPATNLQEGFSEVVCPYYYFANNVVNDPRTKCIICPLAETCGLSKHLKVYFREYYLGESSRPLEDAEIDRELAFSECFPIGSNNPAASLLTMDHSCGCVRYNIQGVAYVMYDDGRYPISKEQVWGLCEMANAAKDVYFTSKHGSNAGPKMLSRWCSLYRKGRWGSPIIYEPRKRPSQHHQRKRTTTWYSNNSSSSSEMRTARSIQQTQDPWLDW